MNQDTQTPQAKLAENFVNNTPLGQYITGLRKSWGWFTGFGILITICGVFAAAFLLASTLASMFILGTFMFVGGCTLIVAAFQVRSVRHLFWSWLISGVFFLLACFFAFASPISTAIALTLLIAVSLAASGILRFISGIQSKGLEGRGWFIASGIIGVLAAILIATNLFQMALFLPGMLLACDLLFQGISMVMFGRVLRKGLHR